MCQMQILLISLNLLSNVVFIENYNEMRNGKILLYVLC